MGGWSHSTTAHCARKGTLWRGHEPSITRSHSSILLRLCGCLLDCLTRNLRRWTLLAGWRTKRAGNISLHVTVASMAESLCHFTGATYCISDSVHHVYTSPMSPPLKVQFVEFLRKPVCQCVSYLEMAGKVVANWEQHSYCST